jgi:DNA-binding NtrC family response regulator
MDLFQKLREIRMLLVDDDRLIRDSLAMYFEGEGCSVSTCETAEEALMMLAKEKYGAIIADYLLPGMDGIEFFRRIGKSRQEILKILITAHGSESVLPEAQKAGIDSVIEKPFTVEDLKASLHRLMEARGTVISETGILKTRELRGAKMKKERKT